MAAIRALTTTFLLVKLVELFYAQGLALGQKRLIDLSGTLFLLGHCSKRKLFLCVLFGFCRVAIQLGIAGIALILILHELAIRIDEESAKKRPLQRVAQILE